MASDDLKREAILSTLDKIYWIESQMEQLMLWESMIQSGEKSKESLFKLVQDSETHKNRLDIWFNKLNIKPPIHPPRGFPEKTFDFTGKEVPEMFKEILKFELLVKGLYEYLASPQGEDSLRSIILDDNDRAEFKLLVLSLIAAETQHSEICKENIGSFRRIMGK